MYQQDICRCCHEEYPWNIKEYLNAPGICFICDGNECLSCGKYVSNKDKKKNKVVICNECMEDLRDESGH